MNPNNPTELDSALNAFVASTQPSKIAVIIPLYGYWADKENGLNKDSLFVALDRVYSSAHQIYTIFVAEVDRISKPIADVLMSKTQGGNTKGVPVPSGASYAEYVREGLQVAKDETDARFFIIVNPWVMLQDYNIDKMVDRINRGDQAKVICGYDLHSKIDAGEFQTYKSATPREQREITTDFMGFERLTLEMLEISNTFSTKTFLEFDIWQTLFSKGYDIITSESLPIYSFDLDWSQLEDAGQRETDRQNFIAKWHFEPTK